jgi:DnaK suppressor protein
MIEIDNQTCHEFEQTLLKLRGEVTMLLGGAPEGASEKDLGTAATDWMLLRGAFRSHGLAKGARDALDRERRMIEAALDRVAAGAYGRCCSCQVGIPIERLRMEPATPFCAECHEDVRLRRL